MSDADPGLFRPTACLPGVLSGSSFTHNSWAYVFCLVLAWLENPGEDVIHQRGGQRRARRGLEADVRPKVGRGCASGPGTGRKDVWRRQCAECGVGAGERKKNKRDWGSLGRPGPQQSHVVPQMRTFCGMLPRAQAAGPTGGPERQPWRRGELE